MAALRTLAKVSTVLISASLGVHVQEVPKDIQPHKEVNPEKIAELEKEWRKKHNITVPEVGKTLKSGSQNSKKVLIVQGNRKDQPVCEWMYGPFVQTIQEGFAHDSSWSVTVPTPTVSFKTTLESELPNLVSGDILVFVGGVGKGTFLDVMYTAQSPATSLMRSNSSAAAADFRAHASRYNFNSLRSSGVLIVYYNTDAAFECPLTSADPVDELWDFSYHNIDNCQEQGNGPATIRYVPPGALSGSPLAGSGGAKGSLLHLGHAWWRTCWLELYNNMPGELSYESSAWTETAFIGILKHHNIFLNLHKGDCKWERNPFAAVRASRLLSAGAILISEYSYSKDQQEFAGLVDFVNFDAIPATYANYFAEDPVTYENLRNSRRSAYLTKFGPSTLFTNAGIYDMMNSRR